MFSADVIIIGSGPAGVSAAWPLVEAGVRVLMLDASDDRALPIPPPQESMSAWRRDPDRWRHELGRSGPLASALRSPKFATPLSQATLTGFTETAGLTTTDFFAVGSLVSGGLSRIWGAVATEFSVDELAGWGEERDEMMVAYSRVRERMGVSVPPLLTPPIQRLLHRHNQANDGTITLAPASNAVLTDTRSGREPCNACGSCLLGCGRGSIYQSAQEITDLAQFSNFSYRPGLLVTNLAGTTGAHVVEARHPGETLRFVAPIVILAAGALMTSKLALRRLGMTGQPVRLESNPVGGTAFLIPGLVGSSPPNRSFALGQLFYTLEPETDVEIAGVFYGADTLPLTAIADRIPLTRPAAMRLARALMPAMVLATAYLPGRFSNNSLMIEEDGADGRILIQGGHLRESDALLRCGFDLLGRHVRGLGGWRLPAATHLLEPGSDAHPGATLAMGKEGPAATDWSGELVSLGGLYVVDGASLPSLSARHPTLTIMANADRIGRNLAGRIATTPKVVTHAF